MLPRLPLRRRALAGALGAVDLAAAQQGGVIAGSCGCDSGQAMVLAGEEEQDGSLQVGAVSMRRCCEHVWDRARTRLPLAGSAPVGTVAPGVEVVAAAGWAALPAAGVELVRSLVATPE